MVTPSVSTAAALPNDSRAPLTAPAHETDFRDVLSALNPLQYLPGVGTIYRAITGDTPPESVRTIGSILVGGLLGGPIGAAISAVSSLMQHVAGIDLDHVAHDVMADLGLISDAPALPVAAAVPLPVAMPPRQSGSATAAEGPVASLGAIPDEAAATPNVVRLRAALVAYGQAPAPYGQRLGQV